MNFLEGRYLTRVAGDQSGYVRLRFRPEGAYRTAGRLWGYSTVDLSFAVHNHRVEPGKVLRVTSESREPDGTTRQNVEELIHLEQDPHLAAKGEWDIHSFTRRLVEGKGTPVIVKKGKEIVLWEESKEQLSTEERERLLAEVERALGRQFPNRRIG